MAATVSDAGLDEKWPFYTTPAIVDVRGLATAYRREGSGRVVVYIHGLGLTGKWLPFHQALSRGVDLIAPEQPGFGETPLPPWLRSIDDVVIHLDDLFETIGIEQLHLVGHGLGGWIAARFAVVYPRRLRTLTLVSPLGLRVAGSPLYDFFRMTPDEADGILLNGTGDSYRDQLDNGEPVEALVRSYGEITAAARIAWNPRYDVRFERLLERVSCPALVVAAQDDRLLPRAHCERYVDLLPDARLEVIEGSQTPTSHLSLVQEPDRLAEVIATFVVDHEGHSHA
ncbi:MAG TPA: alpha/beta hydrolase [Solirubrobacteraceae bacterium]|nr:alpha/beta hydrolase [Solirubrobacteraceae bacterium]